jgi:hypothetical protein
MPWQKGQSSNPGGLSKGSKRKLTDASIRTLARDWQAHGKEVIKRVRADNPAAYFKAMLSLVPKDVRVEGELSQAPLYTEPLSATMAFVESVVSECDESSQIHELDKNKSEAVE